jgi:hypothetical protein
MLKHWGQRVCEVAFGGLPERVFRDKVCCENRTFNAGKEESTHEEKD